MSWNSTDIREIRKFGFVAFVFFGCLCGLGIWRQKVVAFSLFGFLSALGFGLVVMPKPLRPFYTGWLKIAHLVGRIVTTFILTLAYYLVITPTALVRRLFGGTTLPIKPDKNISSYWIHRSEPAQPKERFVKRF